MQYLIFEDIDQRPSSEASLNPTVCGLNVCPMRKVEPLTGPSPQQTSDFHRSETLTTAGLLGRSECFASKARHATFAIARCYTERMGNQTLLTKRDSPEHVRKIRRGAGLSITMR